MTVQNDTNPRQSIDDVKIGDGVRICDFVNLYGCSIGDGAMIGTFVEIQRDAVIGKRCRIQSHSFICSGVSLEDDVFVGHGVMFINDKHPTVHGSKDGSWVMAPVHVGAGTSIGTGAVIMGGVTIGKKAVIGAGAVVTKDVADGETVVGVPARVVSR